MRIKKMLAQNGNAFLETMRTKTPMAYAMAEKLATSEMDESGEINIKTFVMLGFGGMIVAAFIPAAVNSLNNANTTGFSLEQVAMWGMITMAIILAAVMVFVNLVS